MFYKPLFIVYVVKGLKSYTVVQKQHLNYKVGIAHTYQSFKKH